MIKSAKNVLIVSLLVISLLVLFFLLKTFFWGWTYEKEITLSVIPAGMDFPTEEVVLKVDGKMIYPPFPSRATNFQGSFCIDGLCDYDSLGIYFLRWGEYGTGYGGIPAFIGEYEEYPIDCFFYFDNFGERLVLVGSDNQVGNGTLYVAGVDNRKDADAMIFFKFHYNQ